MKLRYFILLALLFCSSVAFTAVDLETQDLFHQANEAYLARDFKKAIERYADLEKRGVRSGDLFYNLGNTYYRTGRVGWAIYYYLKALSLDPRDRDFVANHRYVLGKRVDQFETSVSHKLFQTFFFLDPYFTFKELATMTLVFHFTFFILLALRTFRGKTSLTIAIFVLGIFNFILFSWSVAKFYTDRIQIKGVVVASSVPVYSEPTEKSIRLFDLHEGAMGEITDQIKEFLRVQLPDGKVGWMKKEEIEEIK